MSFCPAEPPDAPQDAKVLEFGSRSAKIGWTAPYSGNSPILQYLVHYKEESGKLATVNESKIIRFTLTDYMR